MGKPSILLARVRNSSRLRASRRVWVATARTCGLLEAGQTFAKTRQAVPAALHGLGRQVAVFVQAVALAHGFLQVFGAVDWP